MNEIGIILSFAYFFGLLIISQRLTFLSLEGKRKFVHILLGNWWFMVLAFFDHALFASVVPAAFIIINYASLKRNKKGGLLSELERKKENYKSYGIVLYPVSMLLLVLLSYLYFQDARIGGIGLLALSYGDGFAALAGKKCNFIPFQVWGNKKTLSGSIAMFFATFLATGIYLYAVRLQPTLAQAMVPACFVAAIATFAELITPFGTDNLAIPLFAVFFYCHFY